MATFDKLEDSNSWTLYCKIHALTDTWVDADEPPCGTDWHDIRNNILTLCNPNAETYYDKVLDIEYARDNIKLSLFYKIEKIGR